MPKLDSTTLLCTDPSQKAAFYCDILGMEQIAPAQFAYSASEMSLCFKAAASGTYAPARSDLYWKIAISVPDLDLAYTQLREKGVALPEPRQFRDVGYLTNFTDPEGFGIELIQHHFAGDAYNAPIDKGLLGGGPSLNLLTLRCHDIAPVHAVCVTQLGMRPLSVQPVDDFGFTLYFYAFTDETPPDPDLTAIANRGWTYRRPYTVLEVQNVHDLTAVRRPKAGAPGYQQAFLSGVTLGTDNCLGLVGDPG